MKKKAGLGGVLLLVVLLTVDVWSEREISGGVSCAEEKAISDQPETIPEDDTYNDQEENVLRCDAYEQVNQAVYQYYRDQASYTSYISSYRDIRVYTKRAREPGNFIVFSYADAYFPGVYTGAPGLTCLYAKSREDGGYAIQKGSVIQRDQIREEIRQVSRHTDVRQLMCEVKQDYETAVSSDVLLKEMLQDFQEAYDSQGQ